MPNGMNEMSGMGMPGMPMPPVPEEVETDITQFGETGVDAKTVREEELSVEEEIQYNISVDEKQKIVEHIINLVKNSKMERAEWEEIRKESLNLLEGVRPPKSDPWTNCSNITTMATATHCKLIHSKLLPAVWNENLIHWRPIERSDVANVEKVQKFMGWVIRQEMKLQDTVDDIIWDLIVNGTIAAKTRWVTDYRMVSRKNPDGTIEYEEVAHQHCVVDNISIDELYLPQLWKGVDDSEFIAQDIYNRLPDIKDLAERKIYQIADIDDKLTPKLDERVPDTLGMSKKEIEGVSASIVGAARDSLPIRQIECYLKWPINNKMTESVFVIAPESKSYLSGKPLSAVSPIGKRPFVIGQLIRRTGRPYGVGIPETMRGLAKELDAIHNQRIDAGSIGIAPFGFYRAASSFKPEEVQIGPGTMIPVDDIKDVNIISLQHNPVASFQEERIIIEYIEKLTSVSAYQMGRESDIVKSRATATGTMALMGQGEQAFTILGIRAQGIISRLVTQILQQYQMHMPPGYADRILGEDAGALFSEGLSPAEIAGQYDAYMTLDVTVGNKSMERQANAAMIQMGVSLMALSQDPRGWEMAKDFLTSLGKVDVEKYIGKKPTGQPTGAGAAGIPMVPGQEGGRMGAGAGPPGSPGGGGGFGL